MVRALLAHNHVGLEVVSFILIKHARIQMFLLKGECVPGGRRLVVDLLCGRGLRQGRLLEQG